MAVFTRFAKVLDAEGRPLPVREALALINQTLDEALNNECVMQALMSQSEDNREGGAAFREKRKPVYKGR